MKEIITIALVTFALVVVAQERIIYESIGGSTVPNYGQPIAVEKSDGAVYEAVGVSPVENYAKPIGSIDSSDNEED